MKVKLLKKLRKNYEIVCRTVDLKTDSKAVREILVGDGVITNKLIEKLGLDTDDKIKDYKKDIDKGIKALPKTLKAKEYILRYRGSKNRVVTFFVIKGKMIPYYNCERIECLADHFYDFDINHMIRLALGDMKNISFNKYLENISPSDVIEFIQYKYQRKKYYAMVEAKALVEQKEIEDTFEKVWHN